MTMKSKFGFTKGSFQNNEMQDSKGPHGPQGPHRDWLQNQRYSKELLLMATKKNIPRGYRLSILPSLTGSRDLFVVSFSVPVSVLRALNLQDQMQPALPCVHPISMHQSHQTFRSETHAAIDSVAKTALSYWAKQIEASKVALKVERDPELGIHEVWATEEVG